MFIYKRTVLIAGLAVVVAVASVSATSAGTHREFVNLKVLPKDVSSKTLQHIMIDEFEDGLGVNCGFCHAEQKGSHKLDYVSDAKPEKSIARNMMRMTLKLNSGYFQVRRPGLGDPGLAVTCTTCHQGRPRPDL
jgi:hypothetical protein